MMNDGEWNVGVNFQNQTPTRDDNKKDGFSKWEKKRMKSTNQTGRRQRREVFWFMSHHYDSEAINQTQHAYKH